MRPTDFGPVPVSRLKAESNAIYDALSEGRRVLVSQHGRLAAVIDPRDLVPRDVLAEYAIGNRPFPELKASIINQGSPSAFVNDAIAGSPSFVSKEKEMYGLLRGLTDDEKLAEVPSRAEVSENEKRLAKFLRTHPDATAQQVAEMASQGIESLSVGPTQRRITSRSKIDGVLVYIGTYGSEVDAKADYEMVKDLHSMGAVGTYDAAIITKDDRGKVRVNRDETTARQGAWGGAGVGALVGILFPPSIIGSALVSAAIGSVSGHLWKGMSRADVKEFGDAIDSGEAALVVVGETTIESYLGKVQLKAQKQVTKELQIDKKDVDAAVQKGAKALSS